MAGRANGARFPHAAGGWPTEAPIGPDARDATWMTDAPMGGIIEPKVQDPLLGEIVRRLVDACQPEFVRESCLK